MQTKLDNQCEAMDDEVLALMQSADKIVNDIWESFSQLIDINPKLANELIVRKEAPYYICIKLQEALGEEQHTIEAE